MLNYEKLTAYQPTEYGRMTNSIGQEIIFVEHPIRGDEYFIIAVCHELKLAAATDFFELDDMTADHGEYEPLFIDGNFQHGN
jgi:hypothetical protein